MKKTKLKTNRVEEPGQAAYEWRRAWPNSKLPAWRNLTPLAKARARIQELEESLKVARDNEHGRVLLTETLAKQKAELVGELDVMRHLVDLSWGREYTARQAENCRCATPDCTNGEQKTF
jgi:hypothetical protein